MWYTCYLFHETWTCGHYFCCYFLKFEIDNPSTIVVKLDALIRNVDKWFFTEKSPFKKSETQIRRRVYKSQVTASPIKKWSWEGNLRGLATNQLSSFSLLSFRPPFFFCSSRFFPHPKRVELKPMHVPGKEPPLAVWWYTIYLLVTIYEHVAVPIQVSSLSHYRHLFKESYTRRTQWLQCGLLHTLMGGTVASICSFHMSAHFQLQRRQEKTEFFEYSRQSLLSVPSFVEPGLPF